MLNWRSWMQCFLVQLAYCIPCFNSFLVLLVELLLIQLAGFLATFWTLLGITWIAQSSKLELFLPGFLLNYWILKYFAATLCTLTVSSCISWFTLEWPLRRWIASAFSGYYVLLNDLWVILAVELLMILVGLA